MRLVLHLRNQLSSAAAGRPRLPAQNLVEFSLTVAAVAVIALAGFTALGRAQATYWGAIQSSPMLAAPTPAIGDFLHPTIVSMFPSVRPNVTCDPLSTYHPGDSISCTVTVVDNFGSNFHTPTGRIDLTIDGGAPVPGCAALSQVPGDIRSSTCTVTYTWTDADASKSGQRSLVATYVPTSNHNTNTSVPPLMFTVAPDYLFNLVCQSPTQGQPNTVEVGGPLFCKLTLTQKYPPTNPPAPAGVSVTVSAATGPGYPYFTCFLNDTNDPNTAQHQMVLNVMNNNLVTGCAPSSTPQSFTCTTDSNGFCTLIADATYSFVYRRNYDESGTGFPLTDRLTVSASGQTPYVQNIQVVLRSSTHQTGTIVKCPSPTSQFQLYARPNGVYPISTDTGVNTQRGVPVTCTVFVMDFDPNTAFDARTCAGPTSTGDTHCNVDYQRAAAPVGQVAFTTDPSVTLASPTCTLSSRVKGPPVGVPSHPWGAWFYASWCEVKLTPSLSGTWPLTVTYNGRGGDSGSDPTVQFYLSSPVAPTFQITVP